MEPLLLCALILISVGAGIVGALFGLGGGIVFIPVLTVMFGMEMTEATAASLIGIVAVSTGSAYGYVRQGQSNVRLGMLMEVTTSIGAIAGVLLALYLENTVLLILFSAVMAYSGFKMVASPERRSIPESEQTDMSFEYRDPLDRTKRWYAVRNLRSGLALCTAAGAMSSMTGVGGGAVKVPLMNIHMHVPIKVASATSNYMIGITAFSGALIYFLNGSVVLDVAGAVAVGAFSGAVAGRAVSTRIGASSLKRYMSVVFFCVATVTLLEAGGILRPGS